MVEKKLICRNGENIPHWLDFWLDLSDENKKKIFKNNKECECENNIIEITGRCTQCFRTNKNWKYKWCEPDMHKGRWLIIDRTTDEALMHNPSYYIIQCWFKTWDALRTYFKNKQDNKCFDCNIDITNRNELHHIIPLKKGGLDILDNLKLLCLKCHHKYYIDLF